MIIYNPAFDIYHCVYRMISILSNIEIEKIEIDKLLILDFYMVFPGEIKDISFPRKLFPFKKEYKDIPSEFDSSKIRKKVFNSMENYQLLAINCLASINYIDVDALKNNTIVKNTKFDNEQIMTQIGEYEKRNQKLIDFLSKQLSTVELKGSLGLKYKTGLMEAKYE